MKVALNTFTFYPSAFILYVAPVAQWIRHRPPKAEIARSNRAGRKWKDEG